MESLAITGGAGFQAGPASLYYIRRVKTKLASGHYATERVTCFCGSDNSKPVVEKDRYGFDHFMQLCLNCGLIYANPRMTEAAYREFYEKEYRQIYDEDEDTTESNFQSSIKRGEWLKEFLQDCDIQGRVVFDIGCNSGGWLKPFQEAGAEVYGVDYGPDRIAYGREHGINIEVGSLETLEQKGKKADLVIMCHLLEHLLDLEGTLNRVRDLLTADGVVFVRVPGLFTWDFNILFQNAHPHQFTAETLAYVMECCGFEEMYCDHHISSLWTLGESKRSKQDVPRDEIAQIYNYLYGDKTRLPIIKTQNKFPIARRKQYLRATLKRRLPDISPLLLTETGREAIILGGGPSADDYVEKIRTLQQDGARLISIERMLKWCQKHGIMPDYVVTMDASDDVIEAFDDPPDTTYLVATQCQSPVFDVLKDKRVFIYNTPQRGITLADFWNESDYQTVTMVNAGGSVTLAALSLAMGLGMKSFHVFGFDCHITNGKYANGIVGVGAQDHNYEIRVGERIFTTNSPYVSFAQQFFLLRNLGKSLGNWESVKVYGDSLLCAMSLEDISGDPPKEAQ